MGLLRQLEQKQGFTKVEISVADYILEHSEEVAALSIGELAQRTYSSNASIIRMCRKLGTAGYKEFRIEFASELEKHRFEGYNGDVNYPFALQDGPGTIMKRVMEISKEALETCYAAISPHALNTAARWISESQHVYIYANGDTYISAVMFANMLIKIGIYSVMVTQYNEGMTVTYGASSQDVALFVSYSGKLMNSLQNELNILRKNRCKTIFITSLNRYDGVDHLISFPRKEDAFNKTAGYYSQVSIRYILNSLYGMIYSFNLQQNRDHKDQADRLANQAFKENG